MISLEYRANAVKSYNNTLTSHNLLISRIRHYLTRNESTFTIYLVNRHIYSKTHHTLSHFHNLTPLIT